MENLVHQIPTSLTESCANIQHQARVEFIKKTIEAVPRTAEIYQEKMEQKPISTKSIQKEKLPDKNILIKEKYKIVDNSPKIEKEKKSNNVIDESFNKISSIDGVSVNLYDYFGLAPHSSTPDDVRKLQEINTWAIKEHTNIGLVMRKLSNLETKLGRNVTGEARLSRIYNWVKIGRLCGR